MGPKGAEDGLVKNLSEIARVRWQRNDHTCIFTSNPPCFLHDVGAVPIYEQNQMAALCAQLNGFNDKNLGPFE